MTSQEFSEEKKNRKNFLLKLSGTVIAFTVIVFLIWKNWTGFLDALNSLSVSYLLLVLLLAFFSRLFVTVRWMILLSVIEPQVTFFEIAKLSFVGLFTTNVLPSTIGGDVVKFGGAVQAGYDPAGVTASLVIDRLVGMITMATFLPISIIQVAQVNPYRTLAAFSMPGTFLHNLWEKLAKFLNKTGHYLKVWLKQPKHLILVSLFSYLHMACTFTMVTVILFQLDDPITFWNAGGLWVLVYFITLIPVSINGLGLQEVSMSIIFITFAGITESNSLVLALLMRVAFIISSLPGAFFLPGVMSGRREQKLSTIQDRLPNE